MTSRHHISPRNIALTTLILFSSCSSIPAAIPKGSNHDQDWPIYGGQPSNNHYSPLTQINKSNVTKLQIAWTFDTHESNGLQTSPLIVGRTLYGYTPTQKVIALDAATGKLQWTFNSGIEGTQPARGLTWWQQGSDKILFAGVMNFLYALDPANGEPIPAFGENGRVDLRKETRGDFSQNSIALTTPAVIYKDLIIVGGRNPETHPAPPGDIRAYDVHTGALRWSFHTIPHPGEPGYETWPSDAWKKSGAANNWAGMTIDQEHGIVYAPTGSSVFDFYGADRVGNDLYANTILALDAATGKRLWHFQGVHHDIWDRDFPSAPVLVTVTQNGKHIPALAQTTKQGYLYLFDRLTGKPLFPVQELPYPASNVPGEVTSPTQPRPVSPEPFGRQVLTADMLTNRTPEAHRYVAEQFKTIRSEGQFVPFSVDKLTIVFPGFDGGAEWGGPAVDPDKAILYVNENEMAWLGGLTPTRTGGTAGEQAYRNLCSVCHGTNREGAPPAFPALIGVNNRLTDPAISATIHQGKGRMPAFPNVDDQLLASLLQYLKTGTKSPAAASESSSNKSEMPAAGTEDLPYQFTGYKKFLDQEGYPAISPPWGTLNAIDLNTGKYLWKIAFGNYPELAAKGMTDTGSENYGGPILTASGILFIGATVFDKQFRAFDSQSGKLLWQTSLPYAGCATPATYMIDGRQYVVIATGGGRDPKSPSGGEYVAFSIP